MTYEDLLPPLVQLVLEINRLNENESLHCYGLGVAPIFSRLYIGLLDFIFHYVLSKSCHEVIHVSNIV